MYGAAEHGRRRRRERAAEPLTAYAESKVLAEEALAALADDDFSPVFMRNATAFGVSPRLRARHRAEQPRRLGGHDRARCSIHERRHPLAAARPRRDIAKATLAVLDGAARGRHGEVFNVGATEENYQVRDLAEIVRGDRGDCAVEYAGTGDPDPRSYRVDFAKLRELFPDARACAGRARRGARELLDAYRGPA